MDYRSTRFSMKQLFIATAVIASLIGGYVWFGDRVREANISAVRNAYLEGRLTEAKAREYAGDRVDEWPTPDAHP